MRLARARARRGHYIFRTYPFAARNNEACEIVIYFSKKMYVGVPEINGKQDIFQRAREILQLR